jgi:cell wall assembly regulator SMI1
MHPEVDEAWDRIETWLRRDAPPVAAEINAPAGEQALAAAAAAVGTPLPADLIGWWQRADGMRGTRVSVGALLPPHYVPLSIREALESRRVWLEVAADADGTQGVERPEPAGSPCDVWQPVWLPIATDGGSSELFVDLRPGAAHGCVMTYDKVDAATSAPVWPSVGAMLADVADAFEHETTIAGYFPWVDEHGTLSWMTEASRWYSGGSMPVNVAKLGAAYERFVGELRTGGFGPPRPGRWSAGQLAAHTARNTELLIATTEAIVARDPAGHERRSSQAWRAGDSARFAALRRENDRAATELHYDNADAMDPNTLDRYATRGLTDLADRIERLGGRLCELAGPVAAGRPMAHIRISQDGAVLLDQPAGWNAVLQSLTHRQLPLRTRQLQSLRAAT